LSGFVAEASITAPGITIRDEVI